ncbi:hypothetical protein F383_30765 [Gossypium arboreum]|uniref:Uncharacterized protein n=1 Tax=Gossypium arboreum TaxID=29729 RepID=A0A0B0MXC2_GOSAR|nr:hypothetical protein F383_30765 [Gossypium arboreum]
MVVSLFICMYVLMLLGDEIYNSLLLVDCLFNALL